MPTNNTVWGSYRGQLTFRYYTYDPKCAQHTHWNGTDCQPDYEGYCQSLTPQYIEQTGDKNIFVYHNGTSCVVGNFTALHEQEINRLVMSLDILKNLEGDPNRVPPDQRQRETLFYDDYLKRKWQKFQLMVMAVTLLGCLMRFLYEEYAYRKQLKIDKKIKVDMKLLEQDEN